jgi:hypothetical protein
MVTITVWKSKTTDNAPMSIRNESKIPISICQHRVNFETAEVAQKYEVTVPGYTWTSYGWADPEGSKKVLLAAGDAPLSKHTRAMTIDTLKLNTKIRLPVSDISLQQQSKLTQKDNIVKEIVLTVESSGSGIVLRIYEQKDDDVESVKEDERNQELQERQEPIEASAFAFVFNLTSFGISVVADEPTRREILSLYAEGTQGTLRWVGNTSSFEFSLHDLQVDNYCESVIHPVLFRRVRSAQPPKEGQEDPPFLQLTAILETRPGHPPTVTCKYISIRILEFAVELDSGTIQIIFSDFLQNLNLVSKDQALALQAPQEWMDDYNEQLLAPESRLQLVDAYKAHMAAQQPKIVFENFIFHPIKISLTFLHTEFPRHRRPLTRASMSSAALNMLSAVVEVELMAIKLNSFIVANAVESVGSLLSRIEGKVLQDLKMQMGQMAGSLTILGSPVGLARNIGTGVEAFFYEPYQGLVLGPQDFVRGLGRGTSSLVAGFVTGTLTSTAALVSTASSGISYLSGDSDFVRDRTLKMQKRQASRSGAIEGLKGGGGLVVAGFASGLSGLFCQPFEGAQSSGAQGFVKGLGLGVAGALVKPTLGLADGFSSAATGISNEVGFTSRATRARPARAFQRSQTDPSVRVLTALDMEACEAQEVIRTYEDVEKELNDKVVIKDEYIANFKLDNKVSVILSALKIMMFHNKKLIRVHFWSEVSHCFFCPDYVGVLLYSSKRSSNPVKVYFKTRQRGVDLYKGLLHHAYLMGNPPGTLPLQRAEELALAPANSAAGTASASGHVDSSDTAGLVLPSSRYIFGSAKVAMADLVVCSEKQLLIVARTQLMSPETDSGKEGAAGADQDGDALYARIDNVATWLVHSYVLSCNKFSRSRCCLVVILNASNSAVSLLDSDLLKGRVLYTIDVRGYDSKSRSIRQKNGFAIFLGCGFPPSFYESGEVEMSLSTNAFNAVLCNDAQKSSISERKRGGSSSVSSGHNVGFIEKSTKEWWSKYCILIT